MTAVPATSLTSDWLASGRVLREPPGAGRGYWAGAPGVCYAPDENAWYLTYRLRRPRGVQPDRGGEARIARSTDLVHWHDVWSVTKDRFNTASIERCCLHKDADGLWRYFVSFVDPADGRWCVEALRAPRLDALDPAKSRRVFTASPFGLEGVKDPWLFEKDGVFHLFLSVAVPTARTHAGSHSTLDIFNTGECVSATALATSRDLERWDWRGVVLKPGATGWDSYCQRINSVVSSGGRWLAFYDGSASESENYEERTGLAASTDLLHWTPLTPGGPAFTSPHASGSLRYLSAVTVGDRAHLFYECARADGAHELRFAMCDASSLALKE